MSNGNYGYVYFMSSMNIRYNVFIDFTYKEPNELLRHINNDPWSFPNLRRYF